MGIKTGDVTSGFETESCVGSGYDYGLVCEVVGGDREGDE